MRFTAWAKPVQRVVLRDLGGVEQDGVVPPVEGQGVGPAVPCEDVLLEQGIQVLDVGDLAHVQGQEQSLLDQGGREIREAAHHVVGARPAGDHELRDDVRRRDVRRDVELDAGLLLEGRDQLGADRRGPHEDREGAGGGCGRPAGRDAFIAQTERGPTHGERSCAAEKRAAPQLCMVNSLRHGISPLLANIDWLGHGISPLLANIDLLREGSYAPRASAGRTRIPSASTRRRSRRSGRPAPSPRATGSPPAWSRRAPGASAGSRPGSRSG